MTQPNTRWPFDRVVVSSNDHPLYLDFWPFVAYAYRTLFPGVKVMLVYVTERADDPLIPQLTKHGEVSIAPPVPGYHIGTVTKLARFFAASCFEDEVVMIDDVDELPIDRDWHVQKTAPRKPGTMLFVGSEVIGGEGEQCPASMLTAEGRLFRQLFNPEGLPFAALLDHYDATGPKGGAYPSTDLRSPNFSDEKLIVTLRKQRAKEGRPVEPTYVRRDYSVGNNTIDRSYVSNFSKDKLEHGGYVASHMPRPYVNFKELNDACFDYIRRKYQGGPLPAPINRDV